MKECKKAMLNSSCDIVKPILVLVVCCTANAFELRIREDSKLFVRMNIKINSFEHTKVFAYAIGFRINFDLRKKKTPKLYSGDGLVNTYLQPERIREATLFLFNSYGWNGTACLIRTLCEISEIPEYPGDIVGPTLKLLFLDSKQPDFANGRYCREATCCPISILDLLFPP